MQRWLRRITPDRDSLVAHRFLRPYKGIAGRTTCWAFTRGGVSRAFALGLFIAFIPPTPLPVHLLLCSVLGVALGLNLPVLFATVFLSNPLTWFAQYAASVWVGAKLMGLDFMPLVRQLRHHEIAAVLNRLWAPLLLGSLVLGLLAAVLGYFAAQLLWRARVVYLMRRRRERSRERRGPLDQGPVA